jgi:hypothetical protein
VQLELVGCCIDASNFDCGKKFMHAIFLSTLSVRGGSNGLW